MRPLILVLVLTCLGCGSETAPAANPAPSPAIEQRSGAAPVRDTSFVRDTLFGGEVFDLATAYDSVGVGGLDPSVPLRRMTFDDVPLPFTTYAFEDWTVETSHSVEGTTVWFSTGEPGPEFVGLQVIMSPPFRKGETGIEQLWSGVRRSRNSRDLDERPSWAVAAAESVDSDHYVRRAFAEHAGAYIHVTQAFPRRGGDRFFAASDTILSRIEWSDDGTGL